MSKERIAEIMAENNLEWAPQVYPNMYPRIIKAMEQYALEEFKRGYDDGFNTVNESLRPEIRHLHSLVQAQKEYIELLETGWLYKSSPVNEDTVVKGVELRNQIKSLES